MEALNASREAAHGPFMTLHKVWKNPRTYADKPEAWCIFGGYQCASIDCLSEALQNRVILTAWAFTTKSWNILMEVFDQDKQHHGGESTTLEAISVLSRGTQSLHCGRDPQPARMWSTSPT